MTNTSIRWGILSTARIAINAVIPGIQQSQRGSVAAIASRGIEKAQAAADQLGIPQAYGSYEELLEDPNIDAVYIPLPNHMHMEWTIRAAQAGKHVLCEKPFALNAEETKRMVEACKTAGVHLQEAFMYRNHPRYDAIAQLIASGEIGTIRGIHGTFTFDNSANTTNFRNSPEMGGGSIYDIGVYPISAARMLLKAEPIAATTVAFYSEKHGGVDMMASGLIEFPEQIALTFDCAMWAAPRNTLEILGSNGRIELPSAFVCDPAEPSIYYVTSHNETRTETVPAYNQYALQADQFASVVLDGAQPKFPAEDAILNMKAVDACLLSAKTQTRVALSEG